jgi:hypothetical protein
VVVDHSLSRETSPSGRCSRPESVPHAMMKPVSVVHASLLLRSLEIYEFHRLDDAEALLVPLAKSTDVKALASFDRSIDRVETLRRGES